MAKRGHQRATVSDRIRDYAGGHIETGASQQAIRQELEGRATRSKSRPCTND